MLSRLRGARDRASLLVVPCKLAGDGLQGETCRDGPWRWRRTGAFAPSAFAQGSGPAAPPPGANDACTSAQDATPIVLVHGTFFNRGQFFKFSPQLEARGYCVFALNYGCTASSLSFSCGRGPIERSARQLRDFIDDRVPCRRAARARSRFSATPRAASCRATTSSTSGGGRRSSRHDRDLFRRTTGPTIHSRRSPSDCAACIQQSPYRGEFTERVNQGDQTLGAIDYTQIQTRFDEVVIPYFSAFLAETVG